MVTRYPIADEMVSLRDAMDRLLADSFVSSPFRSLWTGTSNGGGVSRASLPLDVYVTPDEVMVIAAAPGLGPDDLDVTINQGTITLSGQLPNVAQAEEAKEATWYLHELPHGQFRRTITLPVDVDMEQADATFEHGVLRLRLPKAAQAKPRQIQVRAVAANGAGEQKAVGSGQ